MVPKVVAVALSGGVDSLIAGHMVKQTYREAFGIHFTSGWKPAPLDTRSLESQLGFPVYAVNLSSEFKREVVDYFIRSYMAGKTPNPCISCNQKIKFGALLDHALKLGADALATGHYATVINGICFPDLAIEKSYLEKGADPWKDQSYFLSMLSSSQLDRLIFPLASITKDEVRKIARENSLTPAVASESQDVCFIPDKKFSDFIARERGILPSPGSIVNAQGELVGIHEGLHAFTIGQRRGINVPAERPYYVKAIDMGSNTLHVCFKEELARLEMEVERINWNYADTPRLDDIVTQIRYSHPGARSDLTLSHDTGKVKFHAPQTAVTPGQAAVFYKGKRILGAGIIR